MKNKLISICLISLSINCFAQDKLSVIGYIGLCDLRYIHPNNLLSPSDFSTSFSYKAGIYYDLLSTKPTKVYPTIGFSFTVKSALNSTGYHSFPPMHVTRDKFVTFDLPIEMNYQFNKWLKIKGGINGSLLFMTTNYHGPTEKELFTFGFLGGVSMRYRQYSLNLQYIRDVNDMLKHVFLDDVSYRCSLIHIGLGYHFSSFRQFRRTIK